MPDQIDGKDSSEWMAIERTFYESGDDTKALEALQNVVKLKPEASIAWIRMALIHGDFGDFDKAIECLKIGIKYDPKNTIAWNFMGAAYRELSKSYRSLGEDA